jgi:hypothetical protein
MQPGGRDEHAVDSAEDRRLAALLSSVEAEANPAVWARVRTRLTAARAPERARAASRLDGFFDWLTRPVAMAAAAAALVVALGAGWTVLGSLSEQWNATSTSDEFVATDATNLMESLLEPGADEATGTGAPETEGAGDSAAPLDSGGRS